MRFQNINKINVNTKHNKIKKRGRGELHADGRGKNLLILAKTQLNTKGSLINNTKRIPIPAPAGGIVRRWLITRLQHI